MTEEKEKSKNREEVCKLLAHIKKLERAKEDIQRNITLFYTIIKTHPNYHHDDPDVRRLELFLRDVASDEVEGNDIAIEMSGKSILKFVKE